MAGGITKAVSGYLGMKALRRVKLSWLGYGVAAYYGLRYLRKRGMIGPQADKVIRTMEQGADLAKRRVGLTH